MEEGNLWRHSQVVLKEEFHELLVQRPTDNLRQFWGIVFASGLHDWIDQFSIKDFRILLQLNITEGMCSFDREDWGLYVGVWQKVCWRMRVCYWHSQLLIQDCLWIMNTQPLQIWKKICSQNTSWQYGVTVQEQALCQLCGSRLRLCSKLKAGAFSTRQQIMKNFFARSISACWLRWNFIIISHKWIFVTSFSFAV